MSTPIRVSSHAISRYRERVACVDYDTARAALSTPIIQRAIEFGARYVRLPSGHRVRIVDGAVVTVLPASHYRRQIRRQGLSRYGRGNLPDNFQEGE